MTQPPPVPIREVETSAIAVAAMASPVWIPTLQDVSAWAGLVLPILGAVWLAVQIAAKIQLPWFNGEQ